MTQQVQKRNAQMVDLLRQDFQHRREPNYAWSRAVSMYLALPGLRGFWPMSSVDYAAANRAIDLSGQGNHLAANNAPLFGYDSLAPYVEFDGVNQYLSRADGGAGNWADITGTEAYIVAAQRGLTMGAWVYFDNAAGAASELILGKGTGFGAALHSYLLFRRSAAGGGLARFSISTGAAFDSVDTAISIVAGGWNHFAVRYVPSAEISIFLNGVEAVNAVGIPAAIQDSTADFAAGSFSGGGNYMDGRQSLDFLCGAQLSDAIILSLYEQTRAIYGV